MNRKPRLPRLLWAVLPRHPILAVMLGAILVVGLAIDGVQIVLTSSVPDWVGVANIYGVRDFILLLSCFMYGVARAAFHPYPFDDYRNWLRTVPWNHPQPLPEGPVHLIPSDLFVIVATFLLMLPGCRWWIALVPFAFLVPNMIALAVILWSTGPRLAVYVFLFGMGLALRLITAAPSLAGCIAIASYLPIYFGIDRSLARFPWTDTEETRQRRRPGRRIGTLGWPVDQLLSFSEPDPPLNVRDHIAISLLCGWFLWALGNAIVPEDRAVGMVCIFAALILCAVRLVLYLQHHRSPINLAGRILTGRWIIPGFDYVFLAPLACLFFGLFLPVKLRLDGVSWPVAAGLGITGAVAACLMMGPNLRKWRLTGRHWIVSGQSTRNRTPTGRRRRRRATTLADLRKARADKHVKGCLRWAGRAASSIGSLYRKSIRPVLPPRWALLSVAAVVMLFETVAFFVDPWLFEYNEQTAGFGAIADMILLGSCAAYAVYRVLCFHPGYQGGYARWLQSIPWTSRDPLPFGSIHPVLGDWLLLAIAGSIIGYHDPRMIVFVPAAFLLPYMLLLMLPQWETGPRWSIYTCLFGIGLAIRLVVVAPWAAAAIVLLLYIPIYLGFRESLRRFPWPDLTTSQCEVNTKHLGWPLDELHFRPAKTTFSHGERIALSLLIRLATVDDPEPACPRRDDQSDPVRLHRSHTDRRRRPTLHIPAELCAPDQSPRPDRDRPANHPRLRPRPPRPPRRPPHRAGTPPSPPAAGNPLALRRHGGRIPGSVPLPDNAPDAARMAANRPPSNRPKPTRGSLARPVGG